MANKQSDQVESNSEPKKETKPPLFDKFVSENIPFNLQSSFRVYCARKTKDSKIDFSNLETIKKLYEEFSGVK